MIRLNDFSVVQYCTAVFLLCMRIAACYSKKGITSGLCVIVLFMINGKTVVQIYSSMQLYTTYSR